MNISAVQRIHNTQSKNRKKIRRQMCSTVTTSHSLPSARVHAYKHWITCIIAICYFIYICLWRLIQSSTLSHSQPREDKISRRNGIKKKKQKQPWIEITFFFMMYIFSCNIDLLLTSNLCICFFFPGLFLSIVARRWGVTYKIKRRYVNRKWSFVFFFFFICPFHSLNWMCVCVWYVGLLLFSRGYPIWVNIAH